MHSKYAYIPNSGDKGYKNKHKIRFKKWYLFWEIFFIKFNKSEKKKNLGTWMWSFREKGYT